MSEDLIPTMPATDNGSVVETTAISTDSEPAMPFGKDTTLLQGAIRRRVYTNLDLSSDDGLALAMLAEGEGTIPFIKAVNQTINLRALYIHDVQVVDKDTHEVFIVQRIVLLTVEGQGYACCSRGVLDSLRMLMTAKGNGPWDQGLPVRCLQIQCKSNDGQPRNVFKLQYCPPPKSVQAAKGRKS